MWSDAQVSEEQALLNKETFSETMEICDLIVLREHFSWAACKNIYGDKTQN